MIVETLGGRMMGPNRRVFLGRGALAGAAAMLGAAGGAAGQERPEGRKKDDPRVAGPGRHPIGVSTYSFWQFRGARLAVEDCIDRAAAMGFDGVEVLHVQMQDES